jgi:two-component system sensor histidine kinase/response regulator
MTTILVVDDNEQNLYIMEFVLKKHGHEPVMSHNGEEALALARANPPGLVVSDILMPVMDGFSLCCHWKADVKLHGIPFVFYTATYTDEKDRELALSLGAQRFIVKPTEMEELVHILSEVIEEARSGKTISQIIPVQEEKTFYKQYSEVLVNKLESKIVMLEQALAEQKLSEEKIKKLNDSLENKVAERTAQLEEVNKELESYAYSVSHDLKAPLRAIDGFSRILANEHADVLDDEAKKLLDTIRRNIARMDQLIDDLLRFSHLSKQNISTMPIHMTALAQSVWDELKSSYGDKVIEMTIRDLPESEGDYAMVRQIFFNLLSNAIKFSVANTSTHIEIGSEKIGSFIRYFVKDDGAGFDMTYSDKLFRVFQRLHKSENFEGTGVGLALVKRIVQRHGGTVWAESKVGEGATFYFTLKAVS